MTTTTNATGPRLRDLPRQIPAPGWRVNVSLSEVGAMLARWDRSYPNGVDLDPPFQRPHVWTHAQRSRWMEHLLTGGHGGKEITFNTARWQRAGCNGPVVLIDGKQRLETLRLWFAGEVRAFGRTLPEWEDGEEVFWPDVIVQMHSLDTDAQVMRWYLQLNGGGTPHGEDELERVRALLRTAEQEAAA